MAEPVDIERDVSRETLERLREFEQLIQEWTKRINLISRADAGALWRRHILDCLQLVPLLPDVATSITDLGAGAGLPGMVLAIATGIPVTLIDSDQRKAAFLRTAAARLGVKATILCQRIEAAAPPPAPVVTARAVAPLRPLLDLAYPKLTPEGCCLFMKGENAEAELTDALQKWQMKIERFASRTAPSATIFRLSEIRRVNQA